MIKDTLMCCGMIASLAYLSCNIAHSEVDYAGAEAMSLEALLSIGVTARKREEKLEDVPVAATVLQRQQIEASHAHNIEGLQAFSSSTSFRKGNTTRNSAIMVRGIGTISFSIAAEPSVSTVVDGVVLGRSGQAFADLYDLERIEILRGPQGMLFGKNASSGVVNITTRAPAKTFEGEFSTLLTNDSEFRGTARFSGPLGNNALASLTLLEANYDGFVDNVYNNETVSGFDRSALRAKLNYEVEPGLTIKTILDIYSADDDCCADLEGLPSGRHSTSEALPSSMGVTNGVADIDLEQRRVDHDFETRTIEKSHGFSVQVDKNIGRSTFTSITAHRIWENIEYREGDFTSIAGDSDQPVFDVPFQLHDIGPQTWRQSSQELRFGSATDQDWVYQVGMFLWNMKSERNFTRFASCQNNAGQNEAILTANPGLTCLANDIVDATAFMRTEFDNVALFGQGSYAFKDDLNLLFGMRLTHDEVSFQHNRINNDSFGRRGVGVREEGLNTNFDGEVDEKNVSAKLGLQWLATDSTRYYITWTQGYKGPGFNVFYNMADKDTAAIGPEESDALELGIKVTGNKYMVHGALFHTHYDGFQANNFDTSGGTTITRLTNAGDVVTSGIEIDFRVRPSQAFWFSGSIAAVDAEIDKFNCPAGETCTDRSGLDVPFSPDLKYSVIANYTFPKRAYDIVLNSSLIYTDEQRSTLPSNSGDYDPAALLPSYTVLNASLGLEFGGKKVSLALIGKNLTDEKYVTTYSGDGFRYQVPRESERYFGISLKTRI